MSPIPNPAPQQPSQPLRKQLLWLLTLWLGGVGSVLLAAEAIRLAMAAAGLKTH
ncbi:Protein of unknown function [Pseudomonas citronellolis]|jgi:hypothetical protein|uniref:DUF2474 family protein n=1 Tax=Pseudomonas citronellolis TaxID=53408 RepID=A0AAQ1HKI6_9PSED|nr:MULTISPECIES: DUF2474 family protein [Pseudomonas]MCP1644337.1 hypothetical protein [Pseudomonas citronellolis]MCP1667202.1 hypothetical protein [Pseudomonas citronellolis]MCP1698279.1 hypothetical protein [Pseudomonas citronellolis]MCP1705138.1 hypothetical protein [Pseudomonas citronellolis]MCP1798761.1 hypothetical protein [Pseudomonas citronellolis]